MSTPSARNPRADASERLGAGRIGLVLEPSRPAVQNGPWFADDPLRVAANGAVVVSPVTVGEGSWDDAIRGDALLGAFAREHWLANLKPLGEPPTTLAQTRSSLTTLAFYVLSPARQQANGKIGLRWTKGAASWAEHQPEQPRDPPLPPRWHGAHVVANPHLLDAVDQVRVESPRRHLKLDVLDRGQQIGEQHPQ